MKIIQSIMFFCCMAAVVICYFFIKDLGKTVYLYPGYFSLSESQNEDKVFFGINLSELCRERGLVLKVTRNLKNLKDVNKIIIFDMNGYSQKVLHIYPKRKLSLFLWEPPVIISKNYRKKYHKHFSRIFTWHDLLVDNKKYFKFYYPELGSLNSEVKPFAEKKLCCLISRNKSSKHPAQLFSARKEVIKYFEENAAEKFDLFGCGWENSEFQSYRGTLPDKNILKDYKFSICYENTKNWSGYVTEKIFDSFRHLCVPVYLGADNITDYVPANCFIDSRNFKSNADLLCFLENMTEEQYLAYQQNIREFYSSPQAQRFSPENFKKTFLKILEQ